MKTLKSNLEITDTGRSCREKWIFSSRGLITLGCCAVKFAMMKY